MAEYGLTSNGINIKRLDTIMDEIHTDLTNGWGVNTRTNPQSFLNVLITDFADKIAELWEFGQDIYYSQNPLTAEGIYLDGTGQYAGITREGASPSYYRILCTGTEGTVIPEDTIIKSDTNPAVSMRPTGESTISRSNFSTAVLKIVSLDGNPLTVSLNGTLYSVTPVSGATTTTAMQALEAAITDENFVVAASGNSLTIEAVTRESSNVMVLSDNLTTDSIGTVVIFATEEDGNIYLPGGSVTIITRSVTGLRSVTNVGTYVSGQLEEDDNEFRNSYMEKIFSHSSRMTQSIRSAILDNCQGVSSVTVYENTTDVTDSEGRYPHSVEVVVDGGDSTEIAQQIFNTKAGGINTFGSVSATITGDNGEEITIRFNRPRYVNAWFNVVISIAPNATIATDYADIVRAQILSELSGLSSGEDVVTQNTIIPKIYDALKGIDYVQITIATGNTPPSSPSADVLWYDRLNDKLMVYSTSWTVSSTPFTYGSSAPSDPESGDLWYDTNSSTLKEYSSSWGTSLKTITIGASSPESYPLNNLYVTERERVMSREDMIEVVLNA